MWYVTALLFTSRCAQMRSVPVRCLTRVIFALVSVEHREPHHGVPEEGRDRWRPEAVSVSHLALRPLDPRRVIAMLDCFWEIAFLSVFVWTSVGRECCSQRTLLNWMVRSHYLWLRLLIRRSYQCYGAIRIMLSVCCSPGLELKCSECSRMVFL